MGIGLYAFLDKWQADGWIKVETILDIVLNISLVLILLGGIVFIVSFAGFIGALRENTCLLKFVSTIFYAITKVINVSLFGLSFSTLDYSSSGKHYECIFLGIIYRESMFCLISTR